MIRGVTGRLGFAVAVLAAGLVASAVPAHASGETLFGVVRDTTGSPLQINVFAILVNGLGVSASTSSNSDGTFTIPLTATGTYRVQVSPFLTTYAPSTLSQTAATQFVVGLGQQLDIGQLTAINGGTISGMVSSSTGPLAGVTVNANPLPFTGVPFVGAATTAADGSYTIAHAPAGTYQVSFSKSGFVSENYNDLPPAASPTLVSVVENTTTSGIDAVLATASTLSGTITDAAGHAVPGAVVLGTRLGGGGGIASASTNSSGFYSFGVVAPGNWIVRAQSSSPPSATSFVVNAGVPTAADVTVVSAATPVTVDIQLKQPGGLSGVVRDENGNALQGAQVTATGVASTVVGYSTPASADVLQTVVTDVNGSFAISGLAPTSFTVAARPPSGRRELAPEWFDNSYTQAGASTVAVTSGDVTGPLNMQLSVGGTITGRLTDAAGNPVAGTLVNASDSGTLGGSGLTDINGVYTIVGVPPGNYVIFNNAIGATGIAYHPSATSASSATVVPVALEQTVTGIDIQVPLPAQINATILTAGGDPMPSNTPFWGIQLCRAPATVVADPSLCSTPSAATTVPSPSKPAAGSLIANGVPPGIYNVAGAAFNGAIAISANVPLTLLPGDVATCTFQMGGAGSCTVAHAPGPADNDGVPAAVEDAAPNGGDGNSDGTKDSAQNNVTSLPAPGNTANYVTIAAPGGTSITSVAVTDSSSLTLPPGASTNAPLIAYSVTGVTPGATLNIDVYFNYDIVANAYLKLQGGVVTQLPAATVDIVSARHVVLHLTDGGAGDEDQMPNGTIVDPGVPAHVDAIGPVITCPATVPTVVLRGVASLTASVSDAGSGVANPTVAAPIPSGAVGTVAVVVSATNRAGNLSTRSCSAKVVYRVAFVVPLQSAAYRSVSKGSTVLVLLQLLDAQNHPVVGNGHVTPITSIATTCPSGSPSPLIGLPGNVASAPAHLGIGIWAAGWYAQPSWKNTCRLVSIGFDDGTSQSIIVKVT
ncbi:MAG: hypothetical protein JWN99_1990 [Ilumatobacteraceae bacterium]|nr:hypothetical protein [Ilumatobacteraceae bacterium]